MPPKFTLLIEPEVFNDIQNAVDYYNSCKIGLGEEFFNSINSHFIYLNTNPQIFSIRYDDIRCMKIKKFPYMIHYSTRITEKTITIKAIFCTYDNPEKWKNR